MPIRLVLSVKHFLDSRINFAIFINQAKIISYRFGNTVDYFTLRVFPKEYIVSVILFQFTDQVVAPLNVSGYLDW